MSTMIKTLAETSDTVTIDRASFDRLVHEASDANHRRAIAAYTERHDRLGPAEARRLSYSADEIARMVDGDVSPLTIWRERAGLSGRALAKGGHQPELPHRNRVRKARQRRRHQPTR